MQLNGSNAGEEMTVSPDGTRVHLHRDVAGIDMDLGTVIVNPDPVPVA